MDWISTPDLSSVVGVFKCWRETPFFSGLYGSFFLLGGIRQKKIQTRWPTLVLASWMLLPLRPPFSFLRDQTCVFPTLFVFCLPPFVLLGTLGWDELNVQVPRQAVLLTLLFISGSALVNYYRYSQKEDWRGAARYAVLNGTPSEPILFFSYNMKSPFQYYLRQQSLSPEYFFTVELTREQYCRRQRAPTRSRSYGD